MDAYIGDWGLRWLDEGRRTDRPWFLTCPSRAALPFDGIGLPDADLYDGQALSLPDTDAADLRAKPPMPYAGSVEPSLVSSVEIAATFLTAAGLPVPPKISPQPDPVLWAGGGAGAVGRAVRRGAGHPLHPRRALQADLLRGPGLRRAVRPGDRSDREAQPLERSQPAP